MSYFRPRISQVDWSFAQFHQLMHVPGKNSPKLRHWSLIHPGRFRSEKKNSQGNSKICAARGTKYWYLLWIPVLNPNYLQGSRHIESTLDDMMLRRITLRMCWLQNPGAMSDGESLTSKLLVPTARCRIHASHKLRESQVNVTCM